MTDMRYVVVHVEVLAAIGIIEPHTLSANEMHGLVVEQAIGRAQR